MKRVRERERERERRGGTISYFVSAQRDRGGKRRDRARLILRLPSLADAENVWRHLECVWLKIE